MCNSEKSNRKYVRFTDSCRHTQTHCPNELLYIWIYLKWFLWLCICSYINGQCVQYSTSAIHSCDVTQNIRWNTALSYLLKCWNADNETVKQVTCVQFITTDIGPYLIFSYSKILHFLMATKKDCWLRCQVYLLLTTLAFMQANNH